ncbi:MAG: class B sortase [Oscillospiraceae bacterium]|nr:class B sortase [Oscillospiraceae bacterium]
MPNLEGKQLDEGRGSVYNAGRNQNWKSKPERRRTMKNLCALLIAILLLAGIPLAAWAETVEEPAVILLDEAEETENETEGLSGERAALTEKTQNNYNHKVLLEDDNCTISVADASFVPDEGWTVTVKCENKAEESMDFSWENTVLKGNEEETIWSEEITVAPGAWKQLMFSASEITEADCLRIEVSVSETEKEEEISDNQAEETIQETSEENLTDHAEESSEEEKEKYHASAEAVMKNANGNTYVLDDAASPIVVDFEALTERNADVCGWLYCPDTVISYPVVQAEDNSFYLHRDIDLNYSSYGTLFTETMSAKDFDNDNSIIYGHHMKDGGMFAGLVNYTKKSYYEKHPVFYLNTPEMNYRIELFAAFLTDMYSDAYNNSFDSDEEMQAWLDAAKELSAIQTDVEIQPGDKVLTLSTCTYEYDTARYVVMGKMIPIR